MNSGIDSPLEAIKLQFGIKIMPIKLLKMLTEKCYGILILKGI